MTKIAIIDFRNGELKEGSEEWIALRDKVYKALEENGCFEALIDGIPKKSLYEKVIEAFKSPTLDNSLKVTCSTNSSFYKDDPRMPLYKRMAIHDALSPGVIPDFINTICPPHGDPQFSDLVRSYVTKIRQFDEKVRKMVLDKLGVVKYFEDNNKYTTCALALYEYKVPKPGETNVGVLPHTDKLVTTILSQQQDVGISGLQVKMRNGEWVDVDYSSPNSYFYMVSDIFSALTNGRLPCPYHRVIVGDKMRYSMGYSTTAKEGYLVKVPDEIVDEDHPLRYKPFDALKFNEFCLKGGHGGPDGCTLEKYCGV